ncbi:PREDICTED: CDP-diacylglycerol--glycerol-3-phosphate 3-phosphatidyltransferase 2-like [Lupinus angustifolius]|uniref:CDP-diacylglycerol--glycerol-3-phosphate 3-phosphatidyltransferase 2-like n=1 Tax=Lupinus angustifolius TaxID=3871 RepID=UPI00092E53E6|nr:PREDICTED: CDP-diacylglycerol--glycerol-3-phosphate 3-phosphatidyltransferase 2-like [Lupinus angustifolius]
MSALKLTASTSIYVRTAIKSKTKPFLWTPNTTTTIHQPGRRIIPCAHTLPLSPIIINNNYIIRFPFHKPLSLFSSSPPSSSSSSSSDKPSSMARANTNENENENENEPSNFLTLPTILTLTRVAAIPLLITAFYVDGSVATTIFIAAAITDWLDGYIARKMKLKSSFGAFLDPVADKLMVATTLVLLCTRPLDVAVFGEAPWLLTVPAIAIIGREITMSAVREWAASQDSKILEAVAVNNLGKWKTAAQMTALTILLATRDWSHGGAAIVVGSGVGLLYTSAGLAIWSLVVYMRKIWKVMRK